SGLGAAANDFDHAMAFAHGDGTAKQFQHLVREGVGSDVVVVGNQAKKFVADATARPQGLITCTAKSLDHLHGEVALGMGAAWRNNAVHCCHRTGGTSLSRPACLAGSIWAFVGLTLFKQPATRFAIKRTEKSGLIP